MAYLYLTHCTGKKDHSLSGTNKVVTPDKLYTGVKISRFMNRCKEQGVKWAIFSDLYDVWFPEEKHKYYEKHPNEVTGDDFEKLVSKSEKKLKKYDKVYFYGNHRSHYFHKLYRRLIRVLRARGINIIKICHIDDIEEEE